MREEFNELVGMEISVMDLSNKLVAMGCEDICDFGNWDDLLEDGNVVVATNEIGEEHIQIHFETTIAAGEDEVIAATEIKITSVIQY